MAVKIVCIAFFALLLLDLSVYRSHGSLLRRSTDSVDTSDACSLKNKTLWTGQFNWTGLGGLKVLAFINTRFVINYCSGRCDHFTKHNLHDNYSREMSKLATNCLHNCKELTPCCVAKRYHGNSNPTRIKLKTKTVTVYYYPALGPKKKYYHTFLEPVACHCQ